MPIWLRAIIFGIELVGFIILSIFAVIKFYKNNISAGYDKHQVMQNLRCDIICFSAMFAIILALFLFTFPSYVFLSYNKLILVSVIELLFLLIISFVLRNKSDYIGGILGISIIVMFWAAIIITALIALGQIKIEDKQMLSETTEKQSITSLTMFDENQVGYTADIEGNIKTYLFYHKDENDVWTYKEVNASEIKVEKIQNQNSYFEENVKKTVYGKLEKKHSEPDYITTIEDVEKTLYLNLTQMVEIKKTN